MKYIYMFYLVISWIWMNFIFIFCKRYVYNMAYTVYFVNYMYIVNIMNFIFKIVNDKYTTWHTCTYTVILFCQLHVNLMNICYWQRNMSRLIVKCTCLNWNGIMKTMLNIQSYWTMPEGVGPNNRHRNEICHQQREHK